MGVYLATELETVALGAVIMGTVPVRQGLEFAKRKDTTGIDLAYHLTGLLGGGVVGLLL